MKNCRFISSPFTAEGFAVTTAFALTAVLLVAVTNLSAQKLRFQDHTSAAAIATNGPTQGVAVADVDGDGLDDVFFAGVDDASRLFLNRGNAVFEDATSTAGLATTGNAVAPVWIDVNNDGALDLFVGIRSGDDPNKLFLNDGTGSFEDIIETTGIDPMARIGSVTFGDYDADGYPDLFLATRGSFDRLYRNINGLTFEDVTETAAVKGEFASVAMQSTWVDFDEDGDLDLFAVHDGITVNRLHRNDGVLPFTEIAAEVGIDQVGSGNGMGTVWFDADLDGKRDAYVTRIGTASLYRNRGDNTYEDVAETLGLQKNGMSWGIVAADFDNDADQDLFIVNTFGFDNTSETFLYRNDDGLFTNVAQGAGAALKLDAFGVATGDFNADGLVDIVITNTLGDNRLLLNTSEQPGNWVDLELNTIEPYRSTLGSSVRIVADGRTQRRSLHAGGGFCSQNAPRIHVGIGDASVVDTLEVIWPDGTIELYEDLTPNKGYVLTQGLVSVRNEYHEPERYVLSVESVYPNPFRTRTRINFRILDPALVRIEILDVLGRTVDTVVSRYFQSGAHSVEWSGMKEVGRSQPSGLYFVRVEAEGHVATRSIVLSD